MFQLINNAEFPKVKKVSDKKNYEARQTAIAKGEKYYFSGIPCPKGHLSERFTSTCNCKVCQEEFAKNNQTRYHLKKNYNITEKQYRDMLEKQNFVCAICKQKETIIDAQSKQIKPLSIDHCHKTNKIRGLLCTKCNLGIGKFKHNSEWLKAAALYCKQTDD